MIDRREILYGSILIAGGLAAGFAHPPIVTGPTSQAAFDAAVPRVIGGYRAIDSMDIVLPPRDELSERLYDRYLARGYVAPDAPPIMLVIAYGSTQDYGLQLHRPESCYPASGWSLRDRRPVRIGLGTSGQPDAVAMDAMRGAQHETILYWTRIGANFPTSSFGARLETIRGALARDVPDGVLVRLSTAVSAGGDLAALERFNRMLLAQTGRPGRRLLLGARL